MKILILLGGDAPDPTRIVYHWKDCDQTICTDGAVGVALAAGIVPDVVVGDMDSTTPEELTMIQEKGATIVQHPGEKDETDGQLAMDMALEQGANTIMVLGGFGGRPDHMYANLMLLRRAANLGVHIIMEDKSCRIIAACHDVSIAGKPGDGISVLPISDNCTVFFPEGFKYPLKQITALPMDTPLGISNVLLGTKARIGIEKGCVLVYHFDGDYKN